MTAKQIDLGLQRYYAHKNTRYINEEGEGKFVKWMRDNGYSSDDIGGELNNGPMDTWITEFDDAFPTKETKQKRIYDIHKILLHCYKYDDAFLHSADISQDLNIRKHAL